MPELLKIGSLPDQPQPAHYSVRDAPLAAAFDREITMHLLEVNTHAADVESELKTRKDKAIHEAGVVLAAAKTRAERFVEAGQERLRTAVEAGACETCHD
jgi:hypothetical protein